MKLLVKLAALAVVLLGLLVLASWLLVPPAAKGAVEKGSQYAFGVPTSLARLSASLGFGTSGLSLSGYKVSSPAGFGDQPLLEVGTLALGVGTRSLLSGPKVVDELRLEGLELHLIQKGTASNLLPVLQSARRLAKGSAGSTHEDTPGGAEGPRLKIRRVKIAGLAASVDLSDIPGLGNLSKRFELPAYEADWTTLSGPEGVTVAELASKLLDEVSMSALREADKHLSPAASGLLRSAVEGGLSGGLRGGLDAARDAAEGLLEDKARKGLEQLEQEAKGGLDSLMEAVEQKLPLSDLLPGGVQVGAEGATGKAAESVETLLEQGLEKGQQALEGVLGGVAPKPVATTPSDVPVPAGAGTPEAVQGAAGETVEKARKGLTDGAKKLLGNKGGG